MASNRENENLPAASTSTGLLRLTRRRSGRFWRSSGICSRELSGWHVGYHESTVRWTLLPGG
jgi:hypothetical protein